MSPRKASLRVAHQRSCPNVSRSALDSTGRGSGCTCEPSYFVFYRDREGRPVKESRVKDRRTAERALRSRQVELDENRAGIRRERNISFDEWANDLRGDPRTAHPRGRAASTHEALLCLHNRAWAGGVRSLHLREIGNPELRRYMEPFEDLKPASRLRYLRELSACLSVAVGTAT